MADSISAQHTLVSRNGTTIANLHDITPPAVTRNPIETTSMNEDDDKYIPGIRRHSEMTLSIGYIPGNATHDGLTGLYSAIEAGTTDLWRVTYPTGTGHMFSGFLTNIAPKAAVDSELMADVSIRPTGAMVAF